ncbi:MAG: hypothetical protein GXO93_03805 [FCB group bacterium]|nr:hypothetical protein [FCB group bacterium]
MLGYKIIGVVLFLISTSFATDKDCLRCHGQKSPTSKNKVHFVDVKILKNSIHRNLECSDCHKEKCNKRHTGTIDVMCGKCHLDAAKGYNQSPHVEGRKVSIEDLPTCITCHGGHNVLAVDNPKSQTYHTNSVKICIKCHEDEKINEKFKVLPKPIMIKAYENSVHGRALLLKGNMKAPACVDCHGSHSFMPADKPASPIFKTHISRTCGKCHPKIAATYNASVHGQALKNGIMEAPTCTDCHGEHNIKAHLNPKSTVYATNIPKTCSECHASETIVGKFGLKADRIATFKESFHGVANEFGETKAANCASCHGVHNIFPQSDERSLINKKNIKSTCGKCHKDLPEDFVRGTVHTSAKDKSSGGKFYVRKFYLWFVPIIIIAFIIYRILEYKRRVKRVE